MEPDHWAPDSQSKAGPAVVTLAVLTAVAWLALGLVRAVRECGRPDE